LWELTKAPPRAVGVGAALTSAVGDAFTPGSARAGATLAAGAGGARQIPSIRISPDGHASTDVSRRSSMAFLATEVSWFVAEPARSPIAWDANADPEAAPAVVGFVQLPEICPTFGTEFTGGGAEGTLAGQNTLCALADSPEKTIAPKNTASARTAPPLFTPENALVRPITSLEFEAKDDSKLHSSTALEISVCILCHISIKSGVGPLSRTIVRLRI
jgi:hypothetical protein